MTEEATAATEATEATEATILLKTQEADPSSTTKESAEESEQLPSSASVTETSRAMAMNECTTMEPSDEDVMRNAPSSIVLERIMSYRVGVDDEDDGAEETKEDLSSVCTPFDNGPSMVMLNDENDSFGEVQSEDVSTASWEIQKLVRERSIRPTEKGTITLYAHQSLQNNKVKVPIAACATAPVSPPPIEINDSSSQFTRDSSTLEYQLGITKLYPHQSLGGDIINNKIHVPATVQAESTLLPMLTTLDADEHESTSSSLPHAHYQPIIQEDKSITSSTFVSNQSIPITSMIQKAHPISSVSSTTSYSTNTSFEDVPSAAPVRSGTTPTTTTPTTTTTLTPPSLSNCHVENIKTDTPIIIRKSAAQCVLDLSTHSLADALMIPQDEEEDDEEGRNSNDDDTEKKRQSKECLDTSSNNTNNPSLSYSSRLYQYSADESSVSLAAAHPIDECSQESGSAFNNGTPSTMMMNMMELKQALPMRGSDEDDENSHIQYYGFGHAQDVEMAGIARGRPPIVKHVLPQTFPSLLDSSMSSSYSVSAPPSVSPSFDNCGEVQREGSKEEREDSLLANQFSQVAVPPQGYMEEPLAIEVPMSMPMTTDGSRFIVDLEQIVEESSGQDMGELSASSPGSSGVVQKSQVGSAANSKNAEGVREPWPQGQQATLKDCQVVHENHPMPDARPEQQIHRNPSNQFFNYRHQFYTEQYHYFDGEKYPSKGGDDDTDSTCSSVTLSEAFDRSVHGDDSSCASSSYMTGASSHPTLSTVSSVTLSQALSVDRHDHSDQGFYVAVRLGDYNEGQNDEEIEVESVRNEVSRVDNEERDNETEQNSKTDSKADNENTSNGPSEVLPPGAAEDVLSDAPAAASKEITQPNERVESDILNMLIPECGVPIPSVMSKMGKQRSKGGMLLPWHSTRSIQNYQYGGGRRKKRSNMSSSSSLFSISSVHTFRG